MNETDDLIGEVEKYPCLWDISNENYSNKIQRDLAWEEICKTLCLNWDEISNEEKKKFYDSKRKQWNNVRDGYRKYIIRISNTPKRTSGAVMKKYIYANSLHFLTPVLQNNRQSEESYEIPQEDDEEIEYEISEQGQIEQDYEEDEEEPNSRRTLRKLKSIKRQNTIRRSTKNDVPNQILDIIKWKMNDGVQYQDEESQFLLSFRSDLKSMTKSQKLQFKLGVIHLIQSITETDVDDSSNCLS
ncbi:hypothetical protein PV327_011095 [Microctonus hyperodae]|uniref:MADF domain-containing protein n=1 Tax=Microctonus hyperodae TaxID=165561 RepID=A0AA39KUM7_MICHY|nr:hypothetical protein PV327_011095 [Microctonus hyperodae]